MEDSEPLFDPGEGERRKREGMDRADRHAIPEWRVVVRNCVRYAAENYAEFTTDLIWALMARYYPEVQTPERRAMGPVMTWAQKAGIVEPTNRVELSERPEHHRYPCRVWRSLIYKGERVDV